MLDSAAQACSCLPSPPVGPCASAPPAAAHSRPCPPQPDAGAMPSFVAPGGV
ncbi:hypothetical protein CALVIDRAFT_542590 [Calocera viscosa TUFC12733]|uniref:Uncharacterized protein n=1 Tax=Calocera viscosa (strain TUFC12733) TaxID=1330018 RepID=A0A167GH99_CALVF|nr:hypothetical protein CALVIDRAFT_542590 [Calocera viscosa TUFC12733]